MTVAMILAAGRGERMRPLTDSIPKPLLKVNGKTLIEHHLLRLASAGYQHVVINHAWLGQKLVDYLQDGSRFGLMIHYSAEENALETAGGIVNALPIIAPLLNEHKTFTVINADIYTDIDFSVLPGDLENDKALLVLAKNPEHNQLGDFCLINQRVRRKEQNQFTFSGVAVYHLSMFENLEPVKTGLAPLLFQLAENNLIQGYLHRGYWFDIGTPERLTMINQMEM